MKILINAITAKKHAGGAFQIAQNFMLRSFEDQSVDWYYIVSEDIDEAIGVIFEKIKGSRYFVFPTQPDFKHSYHVVKKKLKYLESDILPDVVYSITAPSYFSFRAKEVMRFTNPWVTHPNMYAWSTMSFVARFRMRLYCLNQKRLMKHAFAFVTQTETTKRGIIKITGIAAEKVRVVNNVLPKVFLEMDNKLVREDDMINIACIGNPVPHKNFDILPMVISELDRLGISNVRFHTTIPFDSEMISKVIVPLQAMNMSERIVNHGRISQKELGEVYRRCQFCFLPTLLEVFSASTVEAMYYGLPIVATNFNFNTEVLADSCLYYEPKKPLDAAQKLARLINDKKMQLFCKQKMLERLKKYGDYDAHYDDIKRFLLKIALNNN